MEKRSYCGIDCGKCPAYIAGREREALLKQLEESGLKAPMVYFTDNDFYCDGCGSRSSKQKTMCAECKIRSCAQSRQMDNCAQCAQFPCQIIERRIPKHFHNYQYLQRRAAREPKVYAEIS